MGIRANLEREVKLKADGAFELPELGGDPFEPRVFVSTYHDTRSHRLAQHGVTLRHRVENGKGLWQLKLPRGLARLELETPGGPTAVPDELLALLRAYVRSDELVPVARLRTRRTGVHTDGAEVVHDSVAVLEDQKVTRSFDELEVELLEGDEKTLKRIEKALRKAGAGDAELRPKVFQALDLDVEPASRALPADAPPAEALRAQLRVQYERLLAHDPGTRLGTDPEELHRFRVATRRLRAFVRAGGPLLDPAWSEPLRDELRWLGGALGPARDLDVLIEHLTPQVAELGLDARGGNALLRALERERTAARRSVRRALDGNRYLALLDRLEQPAPSLAETTTLAEIQAGEHRRLKKEMEALADDSPDEALHVARIKVKRARYAAELRGDRSYVAAAKSLQDVLGEHQDAAVAAARLRVLAETVPGAGVAAGRLVEREQARA
ncbi:MAG: CYTH and CHAD domain-containing protein, partial [Actinobacteria bacterium]|nr:CYTH and CHAD domain-containing protein [Actinomycetota bacterium]